jgi:hypothetical protein
MSRYRGLKHYSLGAVCVAILTVIQGCSLAEATRAFLLILALLLPGMAAEPADVPSENTLLIFVPDRRNHRIQTFDANGQFLFMFGHDVVDDNGDTGFEVCTVPDICKDGTLGSGIGQFNKPFSMAVTPDDNLFVADTFNNRIQVFDLNGAFLFTFGSLGAVAKQFNRPNDIEVAPNGNLIITDKNNQRIQVFDTSGDFLFAFGHDVISGNANTGFEICTPSDVCQAGSQGNANGQFDDLSGVAVLPNGNIVTSEVNNDRIQIFDAHGQFLTQFGSFGTGSGQMDEVGDVAAGSNGNLVVSDKNNHRIQVFNANGDFLFAFGHDVISGNANTGFEICKPSDDCQAGSSGNANGQFNTPDGAAVAPNGEIFVSDRNNHRIHVFNASGKFLFTFGSNGTGDGQFDDVLGVAVGVF